MNFPFTFVAKDIESYAGKKVFYIKDAKICLGEIHSVQATYSSHSAGWSIGAVYIKTWEDPSEVTGTVRKADFDNLYDSESQAEKAVAKIKENKKLEAKEQKAELKKQIELLSKKIELLDRL